MPYADYEKQKESQRRSHQKYREKRNKKSREWFARLSESDRKRYRRRTVWKHRGLNPDEVEQLLAKHVSCEICGRQNKLVIDHNHKTGKLRGVLCPKCNTGIGLLCDNAALCEKAAQYLRSSE